MTDVPT